MPEGYESERVQHAIRGAGRENIKFYRACERARGGEGD